MLLCTKISNILIVCPKVVVKNTAWMQHIFLRYSSGSHYLHDHERVKHIEFKFHVWKFSYFCPQHRSICMCVATLYITSTIYVLHQFSSVAFTQYSGIVPYTFNLCFYNLIWFATFCVQTYIYFSFIIYIGLFIQIVNASQFTNAINTFLLI